ncbi:MAG: NYN domain-containing protein [Ignavibacteriales bacterium]|nr:NYN domain-containing protein [Ignavibacteriales bacterium]
MRIYFIDGNNLMGKIPSLKNKIKSDKIYVREQLVVQLDRAFGNSNNKVTLFLDGYMNDLIRSNKMTIVYSNSRPADLVIKDEIDRSKNPRKLIVVSSDHEVINYGKKSCCDTMTSEDFIARFFSKGNEKEEIEKIKDLEKQTDEFKKLFGI